MKKINYTYMCIIAKRIIDVIQQLYCALAKCTKMLRVQMIMEAVKTRIEVMASTIKNYTKIFNNKIIDVLIQLPIKEYSKELNKIVHGHSKSPWLIIGLLILQKKLVHFKSVFLK